MRRAYGTRANLGNWKLFLPLGCTEGFYLREVNKFRIGCIAELRVACFYGSPAGSVDPMSTWEETSLL